MSICQLVMQQLLDAQQVQQHHMTVLLTYTLQSAKQEARHSQMSSIAHLSALSRGLAPCKLFGMQLVTMLLDTLHLHARSISN